MTNYRYICLMSIIPKMFESIISKKIIPFLSPLSCNDQHSFIKYRSTTTNQLVLQKFVLNVDVVYTDFVKAFDMVDYTILISKLHSIGIRNPFLSLILYFLSNRKQIITFKNFKSESYFILLKIWCKYN